MVATGTPADPESKGGSEATVPASPSGPAMLLGLVHLLPAVVGNT